MLVTLIISIIPFSSASAATIIVEAEGGQLTGTQVSTATPGYSGSGYVTGFDNDGDSLKVTAQIATQGLYLIKIRYNSPSGPKSTTISLNNTAAGSVDFAQTTGFTEITATKMLLNAGTNTIQIDRGWGWFDIDYIKIETAPAPATHTVSNTLVNPNATAATKNLMSFLVDNYGSKILSGQQGIENVPWLQSNVGKKPAIVGFDFMDYSPTRVAHGTTSSEVENAINWDSQGGIVTFLWHWNAPAGIIDQQGKEWWRAFYTDSTTFDIAYALSHTSSTDYQKLISDIDAIAVQLKRLQTANVPVLFRPLHEADGGWFWWGAKGPEPAKQLYRLMYDRLTNYHQINNLIWIWNSTSPDWYPGSDVVDIISTDSYPTAGDYSTQISQYDNLNNIVSNSKIVAMTENGPIPDPDLLPIYHADWSWFCTWVGSHLTDGITNSLNHLIKVYNSSYVLTLDELPNVKNYRSPVYSFENSTQGWAGFNLSGGPWLATDWAGIGNNSLKADITLGGGEYFLSYTGANNFSGKTKLTAQVKHATWSNAGSGLTAKLFIKTGSGWSWSDGGSVTINSTSATTLTLNLSGIANLGDVKEVGVQFLSPANSSGVTSIYVDSVTLQ
ncbi:glycosyl hydrolase [Paenibacillus sp. YAF4_2]|uniref:glycosyl hydrolase n=1 Tax=Paenibacillus sp. YAF4_2 TaxID=3233085 RepID=UPI003F980DE6